LDLYDKDETGNILLKYVLPVYNIAQKGGLSPSGSLRGCPFDSERDLEGFFLEINTHEQK
jgi:hypothetical protein